MAPVARKLAVNWGVLEPLQTAASLAGQIEELKTALEMYGDLPITLIGYSWGAWLSFMAAAHYPAFIKKLILVGSGPFEEKYVAKLQKNRFNRLNEAERGEFKAIAKALADPTTTDKNALLAQLGALAAKTDMYDPLIDESGESGAIGPSR